MIVYENTKREFLDDVFKEDIEQIILEAFSRRTGRKVSQQEIKAWAASLQFMGKVLNDPSIPEDCGVAIEYTIPQTAKRVDFLVTGHTADGSPSLVVVELKQWEAAEVTSKDAIVRTRFAGGSAETSHPSYQAWTYVALLKGFNAAVEEGGIELRSCAYLHNYPTHGSPLNDPFYKSHVDKAPLFLSGSDERRRLRAFIAQHVRTGDGKHTLYRIEHGRIRPSRSLADALVGMLENASEFVLVDDQKLVFEEAIHLAHRAAAGAKQVLIVEGGPGTGKSVVAVNLLVRLIGGGMTAKYVTKNAAPREVYLAKLQGHPRRTEFAHLFASSGSFIERPDEEFGALVVDEAHRLREKSGMISNRGENQIKELIAAARLSVFFIDQSQKVTLKDIGTKAAIRQWARKAGAQVHEMELASQFRCNGSDGYLAWLDHTLQVRQTANEFLDPSEFDFRVIDSPTELRRLIEEKNAERNRARIVAGYCWPWPSKNDAKAWDIVLPEHEFRARWNLTVDGNLWMINPNSVREIGCIHTCQGLEVDYIGVIVGDDLVVRDGKVITEPTARARSDSSVKGLKKLAKQDAAAAAREADVIIKNTYRTLMTRGMKGCYVYCTDAETAQFLRSRLIAKSTPVEAYADTPPEWRRRWAPTADPSGQPGTAVSALHGAFEAQAANAPRFRILDRHAVRPFETAIPVTTLKIAAGAFGASQDDAGFTQWAAPDGVVIGPGMFIAQVVGESMNRRVPNGAWCVFRANPAGTRNGKIVIAQHRSIEDPETGGSYTLKRYASEKVAAEGGGWRHARIVLSPESSDSAFRPIVLEPSEAAEVTIVAELVSVLA